MSMAKKEHKKILKQKNLVLHRQEAALFASFMAGSVFKDKQIDAESFSFVSLSSFKPNAFQCALMPMVTSVRFLVEEIETAPVFFNSAFVASRRVPGYANK